MREQRRETLVPKNLGSPTATIPKRMPVLDVANGELVRDTCARMPQLRASFGNVMLSFWGFRFRDFDVENRVHRIPGL